MCGRVVCGLDTETLIKISRTSVMRNQIRYTPSYNIAPNRHISAIYRSIPRDKDDCNNNGICVDSKCYCKDGFSGSTCEFKACPNDCSKNGECIKGKCFCKSGFMGDVKNYKKKF